MSVGKAHRGEVWTDVLRWYQAEVVINNDGWGEFKCSPRSVSVYACRSASGREEFIQPVYLRARL